MAEYLLSFDLRADFACFKKPDINDSIKGIVLTFNCLHKPALLGILGAIVGLKGYSSKGVFPEYYNLLKNLPVGIEPLEGFHEKGNFTKTIIKYTNTIGYANADGNLIVTEQTLVCPGYRCYVLLDDAVELQLKLLEQLRQAQSVYLPYLGKNEFSAWWERDSVFIHDFEPVQQVEGGLSISSIFRKNFTIKNEQEEDANPFDFLDLTLKPDLFFYFERLPINFDGILPQYQLADFAYTNASIKAKNMISLYFLKEQKKYVQLF